MTDEAYESVGEGPIELIKALATKIPSSGSRIRKSSVNPNPGPLRRPG